MEGRYLCSATYLRVRGPLQVLPFLVASFRATLAAWRTPGVARVRLMGFPLVPVYLTLTVWESEEAMLRFVRSGGHRAAMAGFERWAGRAKFVRFSSDTRRVGWRRAFAELRDPDGTYSRAAGYWRRSAAETPATTA
jgi:hypothetical protein